MMHRVIDKDVEQIIVRADLVDKDIDEMDLKPRFNSACKLYCDQLEKDEMLRQGAIYVLTGAHLMGGEIMHRRLVGFPVNHLQWDDRQLAINELRKFRERPELVDQARACFQALLNMMDEIQAKDSQ